MLELQTCYFYLRKNYKTARSRNAKPFLRATIEQFKMLCA